MAEYIERASLDIPVLPKEYRNYSTFNLDDAYEDGWNEAIACLLKIPTANVVEVVRCRDCKYMIRQSHTRYCTVWHGVNRMGDNGFCNYGELEEGNDNGT